MSLSGKTLCFTGTLSSVTRAAAADLAKKAGATVAGSVTAAVTVLVCGTGAGKKEEDAKKKKIEVWTEQQFLDKVKGGAAAPAAASESDDDDDDDDDDDEDEDEEETPTAGADAGSELKGKKIVFTGKLSQPRTDMEKKATAAGAIVAGSISGATQILVAGADAGSKLAKAKRLGVTVMTEQKFLELCGGGGGNKKHRADDDDDEDDDDANVGNAGGGNNNNNNNDGDVAFIFFDTCNDMETELMEFDANEAWTSVLHDAAEQFGYESGAQINGKSKRTNEKIPRKTTAGEVFAKCGRDILVVPKS